MDNSPNGKPSPPRLGFVKFITIRWWLHPNQDEETMKKEKDTAETALDNRYAAMAQQFATYGVIINQMEASFSGLKMMIQQSIASK